MANYDGEIDLHRVDEDVGLLDPTAQENPIVSAPRERFPQPSGRQRELEERIDQLQLEVQRRSAHYYIAQYINLRSGIISRRKDFDTTSEMSDEDWFNDLVESVLATESHDPHNKPGDLSGDVWRWIAARDQLESDLVILRQKLDNISAQTTQAGRRSLISPIALLLLYGALDVRHAKKSLAVIHWTIFALAVTRSVAYSAGVVLFSSLQWTVQMVQRNMQRGQLSVSDASDFSFWPWDLAGFGGFSGRDAHASPRPPAFRLSYILSLWGRLENAVAASAILVADGARSLLMGRN